MRSTTMRRRWPRSSRRSQRSLELTRQGYRVGNADVLGLLTAQRFQELARVGLVQGRARQLSDTVRLHLASGSGAG
jgi:outer membrane protein TolC